MGAASQANPLLPGAVVIERAGIPTEVRANRELVLRMLSPTKHDRGKYTGEGSYSCPELTLGSYYSGPTRISLIDTNAGKIVNTIKLTHAYGKEDSFDIPYRIIGLETAFFEAEACMGLETTLVGYSVGRDTVIQYEIELSVTGQRKPLRSTWVEYLFAKEPIGPGRWKYTIDYTGRGGTLDSYDVHYDRTREEFRGSFSQSVPGHDSKPKMRGSP